MAKVSVIIPIYGVEQYIERCARSLFEQTLDDIEYIFVNDCTLDKSVEVLQSILDEYPYRKTQVIIHNMTTNVGLPAVRCWGIKHATGDFIIHCDSDDWVERNAYDDLYRMAIDGKYDMVWCDYFRTDGSSKQLYHQGISMNRDKVIRKLLVNQCLGSLCVHMCKRNLYTENNIIFPKDSMTEDLVVTLQLTLMSSKIGYLDKPLYYYYYNESSICNVLDERKILDNFNGLLRNSEIIFDVLKKNNILDLYKLELVCKKCLDKELIIGLLDKRLYRKLWINTYPEINRFIKSNPYISFRIKLRSFFILNHLYALYRVLLSFYKIVR